MKKYSTQLVDALDTEPNMMFTLYLDTSAPIIASQISEDLYKAFQETEWFVGKHTRDPLTFVTPVLGFDTVMMVTNVTMWNLLAARGSTVFVPVGITAHADNLGGRNIPGVSVQVG